MTLFQGQSTSHDFLDPANFKITIMKCPNISWYTQRISLPGLQSGIILQPNPFSNIPHAGDHIDFDPLAFSFMVAADLGDYIEIYDWMVALGFPETWEQYKALKEEAKWSGHGLATDISVLVLSSMQVPIFEITYKGAFPTSLSGFQLDTTLPTVQYVTADVTFSYTDWTLSPIPGAC